MKARDRAEIFLKSQFPNSEIDVVDTFYFIPDVLLSGTDVRAAPWARDFALLEVISRSLQAATSAWADLSAETRRLLGDIGRQMAIAEYQVTGKAPKFLSASPKGAPSTMPRRSSALADAKAQTGDTVSLSPQAVRANLPGKVRLIREARRVWEKYLGELPPKRPSPKSNYGRFVDALFEYVGVNWDQESTFKAVERFEREEREINKDS